MELDLLITELDETTIQIDKMRYLTTQISTKAGEKTKHAKNALQYDFESQERRTHHDRQYEAHFRLFLHKIS